MALDREIALADAAAGIGAIEDVVMLGLQVRGTFQGHRAADMDVGGFDLGLGETEEGQELERHVVELLGRDLERAGEEILAQRPLVEDELDVEGALQPLLDRLDLLVGEALGTQGRGIDARRLLHRAMADGIGLDLGDIGLAVAERTQRIRHSAVDDLEVAAAGELLELHQREIRLDAGGVAIHDEADRAGRRDHGRLGVAVAVALALLQRLVPDDARALRHGHGRTAEAGEGGVVERHRGDAQALIAVGEAMGRRAVVADDAQHVAGVLLVAGEGAEFAGHLGRGRIGDAGHDRGQRTGEGAALVGVVAEAHGHQQAADIGVAEAERAVLVG